MKTAIEIIFEKHDKEFDKMNFLRWLSDNRKSILEAEKEQITASYHEGFFDGRRWSDKQLGANVDLFYKNGHDYFIKTFKSDE